MSQINFKEMIQFGQTIFLEGIKKLKEIKNRNPSYKMRSISDNKKFAVVEFIHGLELIFKAILVKNGYEIHKISNNKIFKSTDKVSQITGKNTIDLNLVITYFKRKYSKKTSFNGINKLREIRNQIIHKGINIDDKKKNYFIETIDCLEKIYEIEEIQNSDFLDKIGKAKREI